MDVAECVRQKAIRFRCILLQKGMRGFTLLETLLVVAGVSILAGIVIVSINPAQQFANMHNTQRRSDIKTISDALYQYSIDKGGLPSGIDTTYRVIGTAGSGCDIGCGQHVAINQNVDPKSKSFFASTLDLFKQPLIAWAAENPLGLQIVSASVSPTKVRPGDTMKVTAHVTDILGISRVQANMGDVETISLSLVAGTVFDGTWEGSWLVHDTKPIQYTTTFSATNTVGKIAIYKVTWFDPITGWVLPTGFTDPGNQWTTEPNAYDNNVGTYASNNFGQAGLGQFIYFTLSTPIISDRVRVNADYDGVINYADVDVFVDGVWVDVFQGGDQATWNAKYVELPFTKGTVTQARFRYNYNVGGYYYWVYEFQFYQTVADILSPTCTTQPATSVQESGAILQGLAVDDGGEPVQYRFQYGTTAGYGTDTTWTGGVQSAGTFHEVISGLTNGVSYHFQAQVKNSAGTANCGDLTFTTGAVGSGWVTPTGYTDTSNTWDNETFAYDDTVDTYTSSYHNMNSPQWSQYLYFDHAPMYVNKIRFYARGGTEVSTIDIGILKDGQWVDLYQGPFADQQWVEISFPESLISQARVRFYATTLGSGFFWQLNEFNFYKTTEPNASACIDLTPILTPSYVTALPRDPTKGNDAVTYYAIKESAGGRIIVNSCGAELGEDISVHR
jgi:type II secretory pathway pseudopilin PulG